jgi:hypothetical protein
MQTAKALFYFLARILNIPSWNTGPALRSIPIVITGTLTPPATVNRNLYK